MWIRKNKAQRPDGPFPRRRTNVMARRRRLRGRPVLISLVGCIVLTAALTQLVTLANSVINLRGEIAQLQDRRMYLDGQIADLAAQWHEKTTRSVIIARAENELGLVAPAGPGPLIVVTSEVAERRVPVWRRVLGAVGAGDVAHAAVVPTESP